MNESDRWFYIEQNRKREQATRLRRAQKRRRERTPRPMPIKTNTILTEWTYDEQGNLSRTVYGEEE